jgi:hypothetical protein
LFKHFGLEFSVHVIVFLESLFGQFLTLILLQMNLSLLSLDLLLEVPYLAIVSCSFGQDAGTLSLDVALELPIDLF